ncbi:hypothetical protein [Spirosoma radiotolerans]|uniref:hypothetical protein n=1 Tax=Spirosoma radiotolerans TaxID=1379870 RepID=UPI000627035D|nr:hypothetical protein [Spirosoma radiotolerans]
MKRSTLLIAILASFLSTAQMCGSKDDVSPEGVSSSCFSDKSLADVSWQKDQLQFFQKPKSGPLKVIVYTYKDESFLAFENGFISSPMSYVFDCSGATIAKRSINYNAFYSEAKQLKVLLEGSY